MRTPSYDIAELETQIGARPVYVNSDNRHLVQNWLVAQGIPSARVKSMRVATLATCYNSPRYLEKVKANPFGNHESDDSDSPSAPESAPETPEIESNEIEIEDSPMPTPAQVPHVPQGVPQDGIDQLKNALATIMGSATLNESRVVELIHQYAPKPKVTRVEIKTPEGEIRDVGLQHKSFPDLLMACQARKGDGHRLNIQMVGPAGSGKTSASVGVSKALGLTFDFTGAIDSEHKLMGFMNAHGQYVSRSFRRAYEHGGVFAFDEIDRSLPSALLAFNAALDNGHCDFPDGRVERHTDCIIIATANTWHGADDKYVGAMKPDAAFDDRFVKIAWEYDDELERAICPNKEWVEYVLGVRERAKAKGLRVIISPRASYHGAALLAAGMKRDTVIAMTLRKGMSQEQWTAIR